MGQREKRETLVKRYISFTVVHQLLSLLNCLVLSVKCLPTVALATHVVYRHFHGYYFCFVCRDLGEMLDYQEKRETTEQLEMKAKRF